LYTSKADLMEADLKTTTPRVRAKGRSSELRPTRGNYSLKYIAESGGSFTLIEYGRSFHGIGSAWTPPEFPTSVPS
jgi:hypothetical protein